MAVQARLMTTGRVRSPGTVRRAEAAMKRLWHGGYSGLFEHSPYGQRLFPTRGAEIVGKMPVSSERGGVSDRCSRSRLDEGGEAGGTPVVSLWPSSAMRWPR